jgi:dipeptidyl aminopeptidase/acylaminoacyl peptidase
MKILATGEHWAEVSFGEDGLLARSVDGAVTRFRFSGEREPLLDGGRPGPGANRAITLGFASPDLLLYPAGEQSLVVQRGQERTSIRRDDRLVKARFTPGVEAVATEGWSDWVDLFSTADGALLRRFGPTAGVGDFAFSPDGKLVAIGEIGHGGGRYPRAVRVFDVESGARRFQLEGHDWQISTVAFSPDGEALATVGDEVIVWRLRGSAAEPAARVAVERGAEIHFLAEGRLLVLDEGRARVISGNRVERTFQVLFGYGVVWAVSSDGEVLGLSVRQGVARYDLSSGRPLGRIEAALPRPEWVPPQELGEALELRVGAALWRTDGGTFLHQTDGPRGWVQPLTLSADQRLVIPSREGAAVLDVSGAPCLVGMVPFHGKMRAGRVVGDQVVLVNEEGRFFRSSLPGR